MVGAPFKRYKAGLRRQLRGRTPLLDDVLNALEESARRLEEDMSAMHASHPEGRYAVFTASCLSNLNSGPRTLVERLRAAYQPEAASLCSRICNILQPSEDVIGDVGELHAVSSRV